MRIADSYVTRHVDGCLFAIHRKRGGAMMFTNDIGIRLFRLAQQYPRQVARQAALQGQAPEFREAIGRTFDRLYDRLQSGRLGNRDFAKLSQLYAAHNFVYKAHYEITNRCNLACRFCYNVADRKVQPGCVDYGDFCHVIEHLVQNGLFRLTLTGGEPFMHPRIGDILRFLATQDLTVDINTNGTVTSSALLEPAVRAAVAHVGISVYGFTEETCEAVTGSRTLARVLRNAERLHEEGVPTSLKYILHRENQYEVDAFLDYCQKRDMDHTVANGVFWGGGDNNQGVLLPSRAVWSRLFARGWTYRSVLQNGGSLEIDCDLQKGRVCVDPHGNVYPCEIVRFKLGNLHKQAISEIISDQEARIARECAVGVGASAQQPGRSCGGCDKRRFCVKCPGHAYRSGNGLKGRHAPACDLADVLKTEFEKLLPSAIPEGRSALHYLGQCEETVDYLGYEVDQARILCSRSGDGTAILTGNEVLMDTELQLPQSLLRERSASVVPQGYMHLLLRKHNIRSLAMVEMTYHCNHNCIHCYVPARTLPQTQAPAAASVLVQRGVDTLIDALKKLRVLGVSLTGGELFSVRGIGSTIRKLTAWFHVTVLTNATLLTDADLALLADSKVRSVNTTVFSLHSAIHDAITKVAGSFERTMKNIERMMDLGIPVAVNVPVLKANLHSLRETAEWLRKHSIRFGIGYLVFPATPEIAATIPEPHELTDALRDGLIKPLQRSLCAPATRKVRIDPRGDVFPCEYLTHRMGNIFERDFCEASIERALTQMRKNNIQLDGVACACDLNGDCFKCSARNLVENGDYAVASQTLCTLNKVLRGMHPTKRQASQRERKRETHADFSKRDSHGAGTETHEPQSL